MNIKINVFLILIVIAKNEYLVRILEGFSKLQFIGLLGNFNWISYFQYIHYELLSVLSMMMKVGRWYFKY